MLSRFESFLVFVTDSGWQGYRGDHLEDMIHEKYYDRFLFGSNAEGSQKASEGAEK